MSHLSTTIRVAAPPDVVFDLIADPARGPEWQTLITEMGEVSGRPGGVGSSYVGFYRLAGRRIEGRFIVTAAERPTLHQAAGTTRGGWARWTTMIEATEAGCEVQVDLEYELPGEVFGSLFGKLTGNRLEQEFKRTYENLRQLAEAEARGEPPRPLTGTRAGGSDATTDDEEPAAFPADLAETAVP
jgi:ribosome-associated toxin RatA of RatAB toxin-antitoxin module